MKTSFITFSDAVMHMGMNVSDLRVEKIITSSMNNYVMNINCNGVTWAIGIRYPKKLSPQAYREEKEKTAATANYLADLFEKGIELDRENVFVFDGRSYLVDGESIKEFIRNQATLPPITITDAIRKGKKEIPGLAIEEEHLIYPGPFFMTKGAPANETLEHNISFYKGMLEGLAVLHRMTGGKKILPLDSLVSSFTKIYEAFIKNADLWTVIPDSTEEKRIAEYKERYGDDEDVIINSKREVFLQSSASTELLEKLYRENFGEILSDTDYASFTHGDAHGANFITVQYEYELLSDKKVFLDRMLINAIFQEHPDLSQMVSDFSRGSGEIVYRSYELGDEKKEDVFVLRRKKYNEIHLIDIDTAVGITANEKQCYIKDTVVLCLSIMNWSHIHKSSKDLHELISLYVAAFTAKVT